MTEKSEPQRALDLSLKHIQESCRHASLNAGKAVLWFIVAIVTPNFTGDIYWSMGIVTVCAVLSANATRKFVKEVMLVFTTHVIVPSPATKTEE